VAAHRAASAPAQAPSGQQTATQEQPAGADPTTSDPPASGAAAPPASPTDQPPAQGLPAGHPDAAALGLNYLGIPYQWGGASPDTGFDCSGFVAYVYAQLGIHLDHYTVSQWNAGVAVSRDQLQPGDLVFFYGEDHVGIYLGDNQFVHAPHTGDVVKISTLDGGYFGAYVGARRIP
jgi:cell wall-associated NlpC family hydrolase